MNTRVLSVGVAFALAVATTVRPVSAAEAAGSQSSTPWSITGEIEESCSCDAACPCWFGNKPTKMNCSGSAAVFITKGHYGKVPLDGLAIAQVLQSPEGKTMLEAMGTYDVSVIYLDEKANPEQRKALEAIAREVMPPAASPEKTKLEYAAVTRTISGKDHTVTVGKAGSFTGHLMETAMGGSPKISNPLLPDPMHKEYLQGTTTHQEYHGAVDWEFANSNYMYNRFTVTNKDYEAMAATMKSMDMMSGEMKK